MTTWHCERVAFVLRDVSRTCTHAHEHAHTRVLERSHMYTKFLTGTYKFLTYLICPTGAIISLYLSETF